MAKAEDSPKEASLPPKKATFSEHPVDYLLGLFAEVRAGEAPTALLLALNVFLLLTAYYLLKVAREPLVLAGGGGAEVKQYASAGQAILLIFVAAGYGRLARYVGRMQLITITTLFFIANLVVFWFLGIGGAKLGIPFYLWVGIFNVTIVAQFWSFAADVYDPEQGKRLFPILGIGSSVGAAAGAWIAGKALVLGPFALMLGAAGLLLLCLLNTWLVNKREGVASKSKEKPKAEEKFGKEGGFQLLLRDHYLWAVAALAFVLNWVNTMGEYILDRTLMVAAKEQAGGPEAVVHFIGEFKATYFQWVNILGVVLQLFAVSRILKYMGVRAALFIMPVVSFLGFGVLSFFPALSLIMMTKVAENGLDYSLQNTARNALWLVTTRDAKYKVKQVIDTFLVRAGDVMTAIVVWVGATLKFSTVTFIFVNLAVILLWMLVLTRVWREHKKRSEEVEHAAPEARSETAAAA